MSWTPDVDFQSENAGLQNRTFQTLKNGNYVACQKIYSKYHYAVRGKISSYNWRRTASSASDCKEKQWVEDLRSYELIVA
jgi:hypothetical protein